MKPARRDCVATVIGVVAHAVLLMPLWWAGGAGSAGGGLVVAMLFVGLVESLIQPAENRSVGGCKLLPTLEGLALLAVVAAGLVAPGAGTMGGNVLIAAVLMVVGITLRAAAIATLGRWFLDEVRLLAGQPLVMVGPYHLARHPASLGTLAIGCGAAWLTESAIAFALGIIALFPIVVWRTRREDALLAEAFTTEWGRWSQRVGAFGPTWRYLRSVATHSERASSRDSAMTRVSAANVGAHHPTCSSVLDGVRHARSG